MNDTYQTGQSNSSIKMIVDIDTFGLAATRAIVVDLSSTAPGVSVGVSSDATGDIKERSIGISKDLSGKQLSIFTKIDLLGSEADNKKEAERLTGRYFLSGGTEENKMFDSPEKGVAQDFSSVVLLKLIDLIP
jgi:hypothetical protein